MMMLRIFLILLSLLFATNLRAEISPYSLAIDNITIKNPLEQNLALKIKDVIENNLNHSGWFQTENNQTTPWQTAMALDTNPNENIITLQLLLKGPNKKNHRISFTTTRPNWRRLAHQTSDYIYATITAQKPYFDSSIIFIAETKEPDNNNKKIRKLAMIDQDGDNLQYISSGRYLVLTPRLSPDQKKISYLSYQKGEPTIFVLDIDSGKNTSIGDATGMTFAPRFSPDNQKLIYSYEKEGVSNIYVKNLNNDNPAIALTDNQYIDTSPCYAPDGNAIVFVSDRSGKPQLYTMSYDGKNPQLISKGNGEYSTPVWSPTGEYIAFTKQIGNRFYIGIVKPDGSEEKLLSNSYLEESPSWSPNGRLIAFTRIINIGGKSEIWTVNIDNKELRKIPMATAGSDPSWSTLNP